jgi:small subunit ribosomal protein S6
VVSRLVQKEEILEKQNYRKYETIYLLRPSLNEDAIKKINDRIFDVINNKGKLLVVDNWGLRKTAYPVEKQHKAFMYHLTFAGQPGLVGDVEHLFNLIEDITKFHSLKVAKTVSAEELEKEVEFKATAATDSDRAGGRGGRRGDRDRGDRGGRGGRRGRDDDEYEGDDSDDE